MHRRCLRFECRIEVGLSVFPERNDSDFRYGLKADPVLMSAAGRKGDIRWSKPEIIGATKATTAIRIRLPLKKGAFHALAPVESIPRQSGACGAQYVSLGN